MDRLKTLRKYFIWLIAFYLFAMIISYIGLNSRYSKIENFGEIPGNVKIDLAQATLVNGRIFGKITSTESENLNGKYLKVDIFSQSNDLIGTKYLKLDNLRVNEPNKFAVYFSAKNIKKYSIDILDYSEELIKEESRVNEMYKKVFRDQDMPIWLIILLVAYALAP